MGSLFTIGLISSIAIGLLIGVGFGLAAKERSLSLYKTILVGVGSSLVGGLIALCVPMLDGYKIFGVLGFSVLGSVWGSYAYWVAIRRTSSMVDHLESDRPETLGRPRPVPGAK